MADTVKVKVLRHLQGDEAYEPGDTRELSRADAERLAATGAVEIVGAKAEAPPANKAEPKPANKAGGSSRRKGK